MIVNNTNYRAIAKWLTENRDYIAKAQSFKQLTNLINTKIQNEEIEGASPQLRLQGATVSTIVYAIEGAIDVLKS